MFMKTHDKLSIDSMVWQFRQNSWAQHIKCGTTQWRKKRKQKSFDKNFNQLKRKRGKDILKSHLFCVYIDWRNSYFSWIFREIYSIYEKTNENSLKISFH